MKNSFKLSISNSCSENFENFETTAKGGFCNSCKKEVVDFSEMSDRDIQYYFNKNDNQQTCGKFLPQQLKEYQNNPINKLSFPNRIWATGALGVVLTSMLATQEAKGQEIAPVIQSNEEKKDAPPIGTNDNKTSPEVKPISGVVTNDNLPLPGVHVVLQGTNLYTTTDFDGKYTFPTLLKDGDILLFNYIGFQTKKYIISKKANDPIEMVAINLTKKDKMCLMGKVAINKTFKSKKSYWKRKNKKD